MNRQPDNSLVFDFEIPVDRAIDNLSVDDDGVVWAATVPKLFRTLRFIHFPDQPVPGSVHRVSANKGDASSFLGENYRVEKVIEDDTIISGASSAVHDARRKRLFVHGLAGSHLTICNL